MGKTMKNRISATDFLAQLQDEFGDLSAESKALVNRQEAAVSNYLSLLSALRNVRGVSKTSQKQLAELMGVSQPEVSRLESGQVNPTLYTFNMMCEALGMRLTLEPK